MKKLTQIFILFVVIIILSSITFINIFKESFAAELTENEKNIIKNLNEYGSKVENTGNLFTTLDINKIQNYKGENDGNINKSAKSLTKINSTNLTIKNQIDVIQSILGGGYMIPVQKLGIEQNVADSPVFSSATLLSINDKIVQPSEPPQPPENEMLQLQESFISKNLKEKFMNLLNEPRKPVENFADGDWKQVWKSKLENIIPPPIPDNLQEITDNKTTFYIVQNNNLQKNLEDTTADIIKMKIKDASEILRDKWIQNNNINKN